MDVKTHSHFKSKLWLLYFLFSIAVVGFLLAYGVCIPLYILGRIYAPIERLADFVLEKGLSLLMALQPWYCGDVKISLPFDKSKGEKNSREKNKGGLLLLSNHRSTLDVYILLSKVRGIRIFAKSTLFFIPFLNIMMWATRQIYVPRNKLDGFFKALQSVRKRLQNNETVHIFPELTRCSMGFHGVQNFSLAPFSIAIEEKTTIIPIVIHDTDLVWPKGYFGIHGGIKVKIRSLEPIHAENFQTANELRTVVQSKIEAALNAISK